MTERTNKCITCAHWDRLHPERQPHSNNDEDATAIIVGECKRYAPTPSPELFIFVAKCGHMYAADEELDIYTDPPLGDLCSVWPLTDRTDWCGDFSAREG